MFSIKDFSLGGVDCYVLKYADKVEGAELLDEAEPVLDAIVVVFQRGEEEG
jgi:hypothetical protein